MTHEPTERPLLDIVADAIDGALQAADEAGLYDEFDRFPAARQRVASELVDRLNADGLVVAPCTCRDYRPGVVHRIGLPCYVPDRAVARLARATAERDEDDL